VTKIWDTPEWHALTEHRRALGEVHLRDLFANDPGRATRMVSEVGDLYIDRSKHLVTDETMGLLVALADRAGLRERIRAMFAGERVNLTEDRPALHVALRAPEDETIEVDGQDVVSQVHEVVRQMESFSRAVRSGAWTGYSGKRIDAVVNIGIGGSDLGPAMAYEALRDHSDRATTFRFVSNVDAADIVEATRDLDPATTLFIVSSKTFTTLETLTNARWARAWIIDGLGDIDAVGRHFVAVSADPGRAGEFGIDPACAFRFWDWVGGRYSLDSSIGLSLMIAVGPEGFRKMLQGFRTVDEHFRTTPLAQNAPALMGLLRVWYGDFFGAQSHAVIPYSQHLALLPAYLQQLEMESNGKSVDAEGDPVVVQTGQVVWGTQGTNGQHAYFQLLHQGTQLIPIDLIGVLRPAGGEDAHQDLLMANLFAQAEALAFGKTRSQVEAEGTRATQVPHRTFDGNRPTTTILATELAPRTLGQLIALYEHSVFTQATIWGIDPFDQWGVELGKVLAGRILGELGKEMTLDATHDASTLALITRYRGLRDARAGDRT
jgi:glucose-6-phosphate isomerase